MPSPIFAQIGNVFDMSWDMPIHAFYAHVKVVRATLAIKFWVFLSQLNSKFHFTWNVENWIWTRTHKFIHSFRHTHLRAHMFTYLYLHAPQPLDAPPCAQRKTRGTCDNPRGHCCAVHLFAGAPSLRRALCCTSSASCVSLGVNETQKCSGMHGCSSRTST